MGFDQIQGNDRVRAYLKNAFARAAVPHAFLISGPVGSGKHQLADVLSRALVCTEKNAPCGICNACNKAMRGTHPDIITVDSEKQSIKVDQIRAIRQDAFIVPNDGARKVYVIDDADHMTQEAQDALLKILEEPPEFTTFLLLCYNHSSLLPTILSRVTHLKLTVQGSDVQEELDADALHDAKEITRAITLRDECAILQAMIACEKKKRDEMSAAFALVVPQLRDAMVGGVSSSMMPQAQDIAQTLAKTCTVHELLAICSLIAEAQRMLSQNISVAHITAWLAARIYMILR